MRPEARELLREALERRLREVRERTGDAAASSPADPASEPDPDPEETLRLLMVRLWPRVRDGRETPEERASFYEHVMRLRAPAEGDLRFFDAWNNAYEALEARDLLVEAEARALLAAYAELLEAHVARLRTS